MSQDSNAVVEQSTIDSRTAEPCVVLSQNPDVVVEQSSIESGTAEPCAVQPNSSKLLSNCRDWYLFLLHLLASVLLVVGIIAIDGLDFRIDSHQSSSRSGRRLYQTQVTALISVALVVVRLFASSCTVLLVWRIIYIILEKRGITLLELTLLSNYRVPVLPEFWSISSVQQSIWATATTFLLWPSAFSAPLASSSVSWVPGIVLIDQSTEISIQALEKFANWPGLWYSDMRTIAVMNAAVMTGRDPAYAFQKNGSQSRRYFNATEAMPNETIMNITMPYIDVKLRWIDADSINSSDHIGDHTYSDVNVNESFGARDIGLVSIVRDAIWDSQTVLPQGPSMFVGKKNVAVKLATINKGDAWKDGTIVNQNTKCPSVSNEFGVLPAVQQHQATISYGDGTFAAHDCYIVAEASITAGVYPGHDCVVNASTASTERFATCHIEDVKGRVETDWVTNLALDFTSETLKYTVSQNYSQPWISGSLDDYTAGMIALGYHAAHSALVLGLRGNSSEKVSFRPTEPVVRTRINRAKLYAWLGLNATLTVSAILVYIAQRTSTTETIRDPTLAALTIDLAEVAHNQRAQGLCNGVALSKQNRNLPKMKWKRFESVDLEQGSTANGHCHRRVAFVDASSSNLAPPYRKIRKRIAVTAALAKVGQVGGLS
jgi:hypothetical protein